MINKSFLNRIKKFLLLLCCPICQRDLQLKKSNLYCKSCQRKYPINDYIVDLLLPEKITPDLQLTIKKWNEEYELQQKKIKNGTYSNPYLESSRRHIEKFYNAKGYFLEAGSGLGENVIYLGQKGGTVLGIDISDKAVSYSNLALEKKQIDGLIVRGDILNMPFKDSSFTFIYGGGTIEHFEDTLQALQEFYRVTKKGGQVNVTVPNISLATFYLLLSGNIPEIPIVKQILGFLHTKILKGKYQIYGYEKSFMASQLRGFLKQVGFSQIETGPLRSFWHIKFFPNEHIKNFLRWLSTRKPFWPMIYANAKK